jgi:hypothetical protein
MQNRRHWRSSPGTDGGDRHLPDQPADLKRAVAKRQGPCRERNRAGRASKSISPWIKYGFPLAINVSPANVHDGKGIVPVLHQLAGRGFKGTAVGDLSYRGERLARPICEQLLTWLSGSVLRGGR